MSFSWKMNSSKKEVVREILNLRKFIIYKPIQKYQWLDHKKILNQKYPRMRYIHCTHLLFEVQIECVKHLYDIILSLRITILSTSFRMLIHWPIQKLSWVGTQTDSWKLWNLRWTWWIPTKCRPWLMHLRVWPQYKVQVGLQKEDQSRWPSRNLQSWVSGEGFQSKARNLLW